MLYVVFDIHTGLLRLTDGTVIYARALNCPKDPVTRLQLAEYDVINSWCFSG